MDAVSSPCQDAARFYVCTGVVGGDSAVAYSRAPVGLGQAPLAARRSNPASTVPDVCHSYRARRLLLPLVWRSFGVARHRSAPTAHACCLPNVTVWRARRTLG